MPTELLHAALTVLFGALAGGITNAIAIWMLFHPYEPPRIFGRPVRRLQGAIPKNRARLAAAIGRTVGTRLLTPEDLAQTVAEPAFRDAFHDRLHHFLDAAFHREWRPLARELPPALVAELRTLLDGATASLLARLEESLESDDFREHARRWAARLARKLAHEPLADWLTPEREAELAAAAERWIAEAVHAPAFERAIADTLDRTAARLLDGQRTLQDLVPPRLVAALERASASYLPLALERLAGLLHDPEARARVQHVLHEILERFLRDLKFHQRIVAALLITPDTVARVLDAIEAEGAHQLALLLDDPTVRAAMARHINQAIADFLRRPVTAVFGRPGEPSIEQAKAAAVAGVLAVARDPRTRTFLVDRLRAALRSAEHRTGQDLFRRIPPERLADALAAAARSEPARALYREAAGQLATAILERPIGRPADLLPPDTRERLEYALARPLWEWIQQQVPPIAQRIDIARRVEQKMLDYPMEKVEELIRGVTERELQLIVRLGYLLGAAIGTLSAALNLWLR